MLAGKRPCPEPAEGEGSRRKPEPPVPLRFDGSQWFVNRLRYEAVSGGRIWGLSSGSRMPRSPVLSPLETMTNTTTTTTSVLKPQTRPSFQRWR
jgi:hypothetical protein